MKISGIASGTVNPYGADTDELVAAALDEAGLVTEETSINGHEASDRLASYRRKRRDYEEATRLGNLLVRRGVLREVDLERALALHREGESLRLGEALVELNICTEEEIRKNVEAQGMIRESLADLDEFRRKIDSIKERLRLYL